MPLSETLRDRRPAILLAALTLLVVAALTHSSSSSSSSSSPAAAPSAPAPSLLAAANNPSSSPACAKPKTPTTNPTPNTPKNTKMGLLGGPTASNPEESRHAAQFAVEKLASNAAFPKSGALSLARVVSAQRQVVAGTNHILVLETKDASGAVKTVRATVYEKLPDRERNGARDMELTKFSVDGPAAEGVECGAGGGGGGSSSWQAAAARAAVAGINARSNSLVPYELSAVLDAKAAASPGGASELRLRLKRGDKSETFRVSVREKGEEVKAAAGGGVGATAAGTGAGAGGYGLVSFAHEP